jgi:peptidoglycan/xylan/chitin deacetylase (PgdA/CDA1 family)
MLVSAAIAAAGVLHAGPAFTSRSATLRRAFGVRDSLDDPATFALTFDDGPHPQGTPAVLEALARDRALATFFLVGEQVERHPELVREIAAAGHSIGVHCNRHRNLLVLTTAQARADLAAAEYAIGSVLGAVPALYRPPYGIFTGASLAYARRRAWSPVLWSRDPKDFEEQATVDAIVATTGRDLRGGEIVLLHDCDRYGAPGCWRRTVAALPRIIDAAAAVGVAAARLEPRR